MKPRWKRAFWAHWIANDNSGGRCPPFFNNMSEKGLELLAPAGNPETFKRVIDAGADAVYFGGSAFGARAYAKNLSPNEAEPALRYAHSKGKKAYLTVNTLLKNDEIIYDLYPYIRTYYELGIDAVIVCDHGVFTFIRDHFPDLKLHISTQMNTCSVFGAAYLADEGADRIVTARELSIQEISDIYEKTGIEIECFVHGALCVCYSGQCLMSSIIGGRSGNRGRCAQPCRLPYKVYRGKDRVDTPGDYILSPKDLCGIRHIPELSEAGVYSLKIEGRMKQADYAAGVVSIYRKYVDMYLTNGKGAYKVSKKDMDALMALGNRNGFTDSYYSKQNDTAMISFVSPSHKHEDNKKTTKENSGFSNINYTDPVVTQRADGEALAAYPYEPASSMPSVAFDHDDNTLNELYVQVSDITQARVCIDEPTVKYIMLSADIALSVKPDEWLGLIKDINDCNKEAGLCLPEIMRLNTIKVLDKIYKSHRLSQMRLYVANSVDALSYLSERGVNVGRIIAGERLYTWSDMTRDSFESSGIVRFKAPYELNETELNKRDLSNSIITVYSYIPMMIMANCINKNAISCDKTPKTLYLEDRMHNRFPVRNMCKECYNIIYNHLPMSLYKKALAVKRLNASGFWISFTIESAKEAKEVLNGYKKTFVDNDMSDQKVKTTYGHFQRGVE